MTVVGVFVVFAVVFVAETTGLQVNRSDKESFRPAAVMILVIVMFFRVKSDSVSTSFRGKIMDS